MLRTYRSVRLGDLERNQSNGDGGDREDGGGREYGIETLLPQ